MRFAIALWICWLAAPAWAQVPDRIETVRRVAAADPARFDCAHTDRACAYDFIRALTCELRLDDLRWGMNGRRGDPNRPSWDAVAFCGAGPATDPTGACRGALTIVDVIGGAGGPNPTPAWQVFGSDPTPGAWLVPSCDPAPAPPTPTPAPPPAPEPGPTHQQLMTRLGAVEGDLKAMAAALAAVALRLERAVEQSEAASFYSKQSAERILVVEDWLTRGLQVRIAARWLGTLEGTARAPEGSR